MIFKIDGDPYKPFVCQLNSIASCLKSGIFALVQAAEILIKFLIRI